MMANDFPAEIEQFLAQHIESLAQLELLLYLRSHPDRGWTCQDLSKQLYIAPDVCTSIVADLERRGFILRDAANSDLYRYRSTGVATDQLIDQLADLYQQRRVAVITQIYSRPVKNVQTFADAFRLRKEL
jgi:DNA-binding MarR family transcriptional regulator